MVEIHAAMTVFVRRHGIQSQLISKTIHQGIDVVVDSGFHVRVLHEMGAFGEVFWLSRGLPRKVPLSGGRNASVGRHRVENLLPAE